MFTAIGILSGLGLVGIGALWWFFPAAVLSFLASKLGRVLLAALALGLVVYFIFNAGLRSGRAECREANLKSQLAAKTVDAQIQSNIADEATAHRDALETRATELQTEVDKYADEISKRPPAGACLLNDADVRRLRAIR